MTGLRARLDRLDKRLPRLKTAYDEEQEAARAFWNHASIDDLETLKEIQDSLERADGVVDWSSATDQQVAAFNAIIETIENRIERSDESLRSKE